MKFSPDLLDDIRERLPVSRVVGRRVNLKKAGREFQGLSPFNKEKSPSFTVNDQKGFYHCFSSGKHGDIFRFVMETEGISFPEAVERLANEAGVEMPKQNPMAQQKAEQRQSLTDVMGMAAQYFSHMLHRAEGSNALGYLSDRGLLPATQKEFGLGFGPDNRSALKSALLEQGVTEAQLKETGLLIHGEDIKIPYDRFRNRLMFPIQDAKGRVIGFGGRALSDDQKAKYLNSPETVLFHKGHTLYNLHRARQAAYNGADLIVAEGYMDVIALHQGGFPGAVAPLGTALTEPQLELLWRMHSAPILCLDGDKAGQKAAYRVVDTALAHIKPEQSLNFVQLPEGQDPDDLIRNGGPQAMQEALKQSISLFDMLMAKESDGHVLDTPEQRAGLEKRLRDQIRRIDDATVRRHYEQALEQRLSKLFGTSPKTGRGPKNRNFQNKSQNNRNSGFGHKNGKPAASSALLSSSLVTGRRPQIPTAEAILLVIPINHPSILQEIDEDFAHLELTSPAARALQQSYLALVANFEAEGRVLIAADLRIELMELGFAPQLQEIDQATAHPAYRFCSPAAYAVQAKSAWVHILDRFQRQKALNRELRDAEVAWNAEPCEETQTRLFDIKNHLHELASIELEFHAEGGVVEVDVDDLP